MCFPCLMVTWRYPAPALRRLHGVICTPCWPRDVCSLPATSSRRNKVGRMQGSRPMTDAKQLSNGTSVLLDDSKQPLFSNE